MAYHFLILMNILCQFAQIAVGAKVFYAERIEKLLENMIEAKPTIMTAVPRFYQNLYKKLILI